LAARVAPANAQERAQVVALAYVDQRHTGADPALDAADH